MISRTKDDMGTSPERVLLKQTYLETVLACLRPKPFFFSTNIGEN